MMTIIGVVRNGKIAGFSHLWHWGCLHIWFGVDTVMPSAWYRDLVILFPAVSVAPN